MMSANGATGALKQIDAEMWADRETFFIRAKLEAFEKEHRVFERNWDRKVRRDMV